ncbi:uncharacterized protein LOC123319767 isoform X3 [Coccinella septempunctata]|uniref:uncharacterized protein LOC123319767 isoform X3 n=1 Tax=Coccinella septempunctata TaxID=41139 RepID=UPI001D093C8C|nr:uncharacterized protein LOC123319767 isoform X3 [Coccinella septempunctata]
MENGMEERTLVNRALYCIHCKSNSRTNPNYSFFRFPKDPKRCAIWKTLIKEDKIKDFTPEQCYNRFRLCCKHFENKMFVHETKTQLKKNAVPMETITITLDSRSPERPTSILRDALLRPPRRVQVMFDHNYAQSVRCPKTSSEVDKRQKTEKNDPSASSTTPYKNDKPIDSMPNVAGDTENNSTLLPLSPPPYCLEETPPESPCCSKNSPTPSSKSSSSPRQKSNKNEPKVSLNAMETAVRIPERNSITNMDDTDYFFLSMSKAVKKLPKIEQTKIKLDLQTAISQAEIRSMVHKVEVQNTSSINIK